jgi:hypothetical protein
LQIGEFSGPWRSANGQRRFYFCDRHGHRTTNFSVPVDVPDEDAIAWITWFVARALAGP